MILKYPTRKIDAFTNAFSLCSGNARFANDNNTWSTAAVAFHYIQTCGYTRFNSESAKHYYLYFFSDQSNHPSLKWLVLINCPRETNGFKPLYLSVFCQTSLQINWLTRWHTSNNIWIQFITMHNINLVKYLIHWCNDISFLFILFYSVNTIYDFHTRFSLVRKILFTYQTTFLKYLKK